MIAAWIFFHQLEFYPVIIFSSRDNFFYHVIILHPEITFYPVIILLFLWYLLPRDNLDCYPVIIFYLVIHFCPHGLAKPALSHDLEKQRWPFQGRPHDQEIFFFGNSTKVGGRGKRRAGWSQVIVLSAKWSWRQSDDYTATNLPDISVWNSNRLQGPAKKKKTMKLKDRYK